MQESKQRHTEELFGIELFTWTDWEQLTDRMHFYDVEWAFDSMKEWNGGGCTVESNGTFQVCDKDGKCEDPHKWTSFLEIGEFAYAIQEKIDTLHH